MVPGPGELISDNPTGMDTAPYHQLPVKVTVKGGASD